MIFHHRSVSDRRTAGQERNVRKSRQQKRARRRLNYRMGNRQTACVGLSCGATVNQIQDIISRNCVVIFSKTTCSYCSMTKNLFKRLNVSYTAVELDLNRNGKQFQDILEQMTGGRTVPRVFINGTCVGGATDAQRLHEEGKLLPLINQCQSRQPC